VLVIQPLRGIGAVSSEVKAGTIDLMVLTRLSAWRIVFGKWVALVSQSALLLTAIIPYLILRYFFGEMDLFAELLLLGCVFLGSMLFTAITVGMSASSSVLIRGILPVLGSPFLVFMILGFCLSDGIEELIDFFTFTDPDSPTIFGVCLGLGLFLAWTAIDFGAGIIAPLAENRASLRRLLILVIAVIWAVACHWVDQEWMLLAIAVLLTPTIAMALTEPAALLPIVCSRFTRFGLPGRLAGRVLYPGWPSGVIFVILIAVAIFVGAVFVDAGDEGNILLSSWFGSLILPALCVLPFDKKIRNPFAIYTLIIVGAFTFTLILAGLSEAMNDEEFLWVFCWLPTTHIVLAVSGLADDEAIMAGSVVWNAVMLLALFLVSMTRQGDILTAEQQAMSSAKPAPLPATDSGETEP